MVKSENQERKNRILDVAGDLFVHYGYDKTTVDDIAHQVGVSKGTIYQHFESKDELLENLILRELQTYAEKWLELIEEDPKGGTIAGMYKDSLYALSSSPFMAAMYRQDGRILGNYLRKPDNFFRQMQARQQESDRIVFVKMMQAVGAVRQNLDPSVIAHIMDMLAYGLVAMGDIKPREEIPSSDAIIEGIAEIMDRALTPEDGADSEAGKAILRQIAQATRQQFEAMKNTDQE